MLRKLFSASVRAMTIDHSSVSIPFTTVSGHPITIGTGSGSIWKDRKRAAPDNKEIPQEIIQTLASSLGVGFNHIDSSEAYNTYDEARAAIKQSGVAREDLWITSKYTGGRGAFTARSKSPIEAYETAVAALGTTYLDLFLLHHPFFLPEASYGQTIESAWKELEQLKDEGKVREVGVSNFRVEDIERILAIPGLKHKPVVNQIEFHPHLQNQSPGIVEFSQKNGILVEAYGPLTPLRLKDPETKQPAAEHPLVPTLEALAAKYGVTTAQILLRYTLQRGVLPITTSSSRERQVQSIEVYNFKLDDEDVQAISDKGSEFSYRGSFVGLFN